MAEAVAVVTAAMAAMVDRYTQTMDLVVAVADTAAMVERAATAEPVVAVVMAVMAAMVAMQPVGQVQVAAVAAGHTGTVAKADHQ